MCRSSPKVYPFVLGAMHLPLQECDLVYFRVFPQEFPRSMVHSGPLGILGFVLLEFLFLGCLRP